MTNEAAKSILADIFGGSPFLSNVLVSNPQWLDWLIAQVDDPRPKDRPTFLAEAHDHAAAIHRFHRREILRIGARDLTCRYDVRDTTSEISWLADAVVQVAFEQAWRELEQRFGNPALRFAVIGVGKLGGEELNFSSDIDLIYVFSGEDPTGFAPKLARRITEILTRHTSEGALYRVDLRLRPEGSHGAIVSSIGALQTYYDSWGETFERLALTKARFVAGHEDAGAQFESLIEPFVYRKYLDFAAIDEIRDVKLRIDRQVGRSVGLERHIKLGRGGIREIEFFVQVLQVIYGGRTGMIRARNTLIALERLAEEGLVESEVSLKLRDAYVFLRNLEHKLQIVHQLQTHELPADSAGLAKCAARMKLPLERFQAELQMHRDGVHQTFLELFAGRTRVEVGVAGGVHRFVNHQMDEAQAREWLAGLGFEDPANSVHLLAVLRDAPAFGHSPTRMKNLLANVLASAIEKATRLVRPDRALTGLARLAESVGAREAFFTSLLENSRAIERVIRLLTLSDYLSELLFALPELLDFVIDDRRFETPLREPVASEDRRVQEFYVGAQCLFGIIPRRRATRVLTRFAEREVRKHVPADSKIAVIALGKFGERDLNVRSDLDIVIAFEGDHAPAIRLVDRLLARLSENFKVDLRLRPDGNKGSTIFRTGFYGEYLATRAETWERMALTKARFVAGNVEIGRTVQERIHEFVYLRPFSLKDEEEMRGIRYRMEFELARETVEAFDLKTGRGGTVDVEFLSEMEQIRANFRAPNTVTALKRLRPGLVEDYEFLRRSEMMLRLWSSVATTRFGVEDAKALGFLLGVDDFMTRFRQVTENVRKHWMRK